MVNWYLDASVALHALLSNRDWRATDWLGSQDHIGRIYSSRLLSLELTRVLRREGLRVELASEVLARVNLVSLDDDVLHRAASIETHIRSLDSIHLATCQLLGPDVILVTHDKGMKQAAASLGRTVFDPLD